MAELWEALRQAVYLLVSGDSVTWQIIWRSLYVSGVSLAISGVLGIPLGAVLGLYEFPFKWLAVTIIYTGMAFPPVVIGLLVYLALSRSGPLGFLGWLFTLPAMITAQVIISLPLVAGFTMSAVQAVPHALRQQVESLGATPLQTTLAILWEARIGLIVSLVAGFGGIISEVGAVMLVGGNIAGSTRVLTTAIVLETRKGDFDLALALAMVLLGIVFMINALVLRLQGRVTTGR